MQEVFVKNNNGKIRDRLFLQWILIRKREICLCINKKDFLIIAGLTVFMGKTKHLKI